MLQPGDSFPSEATDIPGASATISSVASTGTAPPATSSAAIPGGDTLHKPLAAGAIAGIVIGVLIIVVLAAALFFFIGHTKSLKESLHRQSIAPSMYNMGHPGQMSPVAPPAAPADQIYHSGGTLYVPIKAADLHRSYGVNNVVLDAHSPVQQGSGGSPGPRYSSASHYEVGSQQQQQQQNDQHRFVHRQEKRRYAG
jgi:hypothetical protein